MSEPLLVLDAHYLCHRAFHSQGGLSWKGIKTGVIFGFLQSILQLKEEFQTDRIAFCFEHPHLKRNEIYPQYKARRAANRTPAERKAYTELGKQIGLLRDNYLWRIGFRNIFCYDGYEADDIMARLAQWVRLTSDSAVLVTADSDLWQCLSESVEIYLPTKQKVLTLEWFVRTYKIQPSKWAVVKAIAGCSGDNVKGVGGVGEKTALRYLRGELPEGHRIVKYIQCEACREWILRNRKLVQLPMPTCPTPKLVEDEISEDGWKSVCAELGMKSLAGRMPIHTKRYGQQKLL